ncbi:MAG: hypothetical protein II998_09870 [Clostridia bacterium]|nr:hypothetical protein [Clostridia bacterium]
MADFKVKTQMLDDISTDLKSIERELKSYESEMKNVASALDFRLAAAGMLKIKIKVIASSANTCSRRVGKMSDAAEKVSGMYVSTEKQVISGDNAWVDNAVDGIIDNIKDTLEDIFGDDSVIDDIKQVLKDALESVTGRLSGDEWMNILGGIVDTVTHLPIISGISVLADIFTGNVTCDTVGDAVKIIGTAVIAAHPLAGIIVTASGSLISEFPEFLGELGDVAGEFSQRWQDGDYIGALWEGVSDLSRETKEYIVESAVDLVDSFVPISAIADGVEFITGWDIDETLDKMGEAADNFFDDIIGIEKIQDCFSGIKECLGY